MNLLLTLLSGFSPQIRIAIYLLLFCLVAGGPALGVWCERNDHWTGVIAKAKEEQAAAQIAEIERLNQRINELGVQHAKDLSDIDYLRKHPVRVLLPCGQGIGQIPEARGGNVSTPGSDRSANTPQQAFDGFTSGLADDAAEWGRAISACKVMQEYIKSLP